jgi:hypothetical protein
VATVRVPWIGLTLLAGAGTVWWLSTDRSWRELPERRSFQHDLRIVVTPTFGSPHIHLRDNPLFDTMGGRTPLSWTVDGGDVERRAWAAIFKRLNGEQETIIIVVAANEASGSGELRLWADGEPVNVRLRFGGSAGGRTTSHGASVPLVDFVRLIRARRVSGSAFGQEFVLTPTQMEALRDFASRLRLIYEGREAELPNDSA